MRLLNLAVQSEDPVRPMEHSEFTSKQLMPIKHQFWNLLKTGLPES